MIFYPLLSHFGSFGSFVIRELRFTASIFSFIFLPFFSLLIFFAISFCLPPFLQLGFFFWVHFFPSLLILLSYFLHLFSFLSNLLFSLLVLLFRNLSFFTRFLLHLLPPSFILLFSFFQPFLFLLISHGLLFSRFSLLSVVIMLWPLLVFFFLLTYITIFPIFLGYLLSLSRFFLVSTILSIFPFLFPFNTFLSLLSMPLSRL